MKWISLMFLVLLVAIIVEPLTTTLSFNV